MCGFEKEHPRPILINRRTLEVVRPIEKGSNGAWELCTDDAALSAAGLPAYSSTLHRYLYVRELKDQAVFVHVTRGAPTSARTLGPDEAIMPRGELAAINLGGGLMCVRPYEPLALEAYLDQLGGFAGGGAGAGTGGAGGMLTLGRGGKAGRLLERLHLKLRLLTVLVSLVRGEIAATQTPMVNVTAASFGVRVGQSAWGLPSLWSTHAVLRHSGDAAQVTLPGSDLSYFVSSGLQGPTVYAPGSAGSVGGAGTLQIRQVKGEDTGVSLAGSLHGITVQGACQEYANHAGLPSKNPGAGHSGEPIEYSATLRRTAPRNSTSGRIVVRTWNPMARRSCTRVAASGMAWSAVRKKDSTG